MDSLNIITAIQTILKGKLISEASDSEISKELLKIYFIIGLRPQHFPTKEQDVFIFQYLKAKFGHKTLEELYLAFDLAINQKLDLEDYKVFDQFSIEYLVRIMNAYRKWLIKTKTEIEIKEEPKLIEMIITDKEKKQDIAEWEAKKDINVHYIPLYIYDYLCEFGKIILSANEKALIYQKAAGMRYSMLQVEGGGEFTTFAEMFKKGYQEIKGDEVLRIKELAKKISVYDYLKSL